MLRITVLVFSVIAVLLGGLWLLQGLGILQVRPILCFAACTPIQGPSATWAIIGGITLGIGGLGLFWFRKIDSQ